MSNSIIITHEEMEDGYHVISIKPAVGKTYQRMFATEKGLNDFIDATREYCIHKKYVLEIK